tara:strand:+ start:199 stop:360 length:162 start_codon:yes stop_codon:yes gene_type:complete
MLSVLRGYVAENSSREPNILYRLEKACQFLRPPFPENTLYTNKKRGLHVIPTP